MKKKQPSEAKNIFLMAMAHRLEDVAMAMYERGIPSNVNGEIFVKPENENNAFEFKFPSYFILAVALGLHNLAKTMIRVSDSFLLYIHNEFVNAQMYSHMYSIESQYESDMVRIIATNYSIGSNICGRDNGHALVR